MRFLCSLFDHTWIFIGIRRMKLQYICKRCDETKEEEISEDEN